MTLQEHVKRYVTKREMSQAELGRRINISPGVISKIIKDDYYTPHQAKIIEDYLGIKGYAKMQKCTSCGKSHYPTRNRSLKCAECLALMKTYSVNKKVKIKKPAETIGVVAKRAKAKGISYGRESALKRLSQRG